MFAAAQDPHVGRPVGQVVPPTLVRSSPVSSTTPARWTPSSGRGGTPSRSHAPPSSDVVEHDTAQVRSNRSTRSHAQRSGRRDPQSRWPRLDEIGRRRSSILVLRDEFSIDVDYHCDEPVDKIDATANVVACYGDVGAFYTIDQRLSGVSHKGQRVAASVPVVYKRQRCPCQSGRRYKNCHGNPRAVHLMDGYSFQGTTEVLAMPEDGSDLTIFTNESFGH